MATYTGMKSILTKFWEMEKTRNDEAYASASALTTLSGRVTTLEGSDSTSGSVRNLIKTTAKDGYAGNAVVSHEVNLDSTETLTLPAGATLVSIQRIDTAQDAVADTDYTLSEGTYTAVTPITITYTTPGQTIAQKLAAIDGELAAKTGFQYTKVAKLPTASAETMQKIYLIPKTGGKTGYVEWLTVENNSTNPSTYSWEEIGDTDIDLSGYSTTAQMQAYVANNAKDAVYDGETTIEDAIDDVDTRLSALESAEFGLTVNGVAATVDTTGGTHATVSITAGDIPMSSAQGASSIADAIAAAGQVDDVQVKTTAEGSYSTVVSNKVAQIDLSGYATKTDLQLTDSDFDDIFSDGE